MLHTWNYVCKMLAWWPEMTVSWEVQAEVSGDDVLFSDQPNMKVTWENVVEVENVSAYLQR